MTGYYLERVRLPVTDDKTDTLEGLMLTGSYAHNVVAVDWVSEPGFVWVTYLIPRR